MSDTISLRGLAVEIRVRRPTVTLTDADAARIKEAGANIAGEPVEKHALAESAVAEGAKSLADLQAKTGRLAAELDDLGKAAVPGSAGRMMALERKLETARREETIAGKILQTLREQHAVAKTELDACRHQAVSSLRLALIQELNSARADFFKDLEVPLKKLLAKQAARDRIEPIYNRGSEHDRVNVTTPDSPAEG